MNKKEKEIMKNVKMEANKMNKINGVYETVSAEIRQNNSIRDVKKLIKRVNKQYKINLVFDLSGVFDVWSIHQCKFNFFPFFGKEVIGFNYYHFNINCYDKRFLPISRQIAQIMKKYFEFEDDISIMLCYNDRTISSAYKTKTLC